MTAAERARLLIRDARSELAGFGGIHDELTAALDRLDQPLRVALVGTVKAGKSTLLNALIGEEIAPTDATECTRVVTWYSRADAPWIELTHGSGQRTALPVQRSDGRLVLGLGGVPAEQVERLEVGWPSRLLERYTLIDTPGTASNSREVSERTLAFLDPDGAASEADAVLYLMREPSYADLALLQRLQEGVGGDGPIGVIGVRSRVDEGDAADAARQYSDVLPVSGLLALLGATLRQREFALLHAVAALQEPAREAALVSPGRFLAADLPQARADREALLARFGMVVIRRATTMIVDGAREAPALAAALVRSSGLDALLATLDARFAARHGQLKAHAAMRTLRQVLLRHRGRTTGRLLYAVDRELADRHALTELRLLPGLETLLVPDRTRADLHRILGGHGVGPHVRLAQPEGAPDDRLRAATLRELTRWRTELNEPLLDPATAAAFRAAARSSEAVLHELEASEKGGDWTAAALNGQVSAMRRSSRQVSY